MDLQRGFAVSASEQKGQDKSQGTSEHEAIRGVENQKPDTMFRDGWRMSTFVFSKKVHTSTYTRQYT